MTTAAVKAIVFVEFLIGVRLFVGRVVTVADIIFSAKDPNGH